MSKGLRTEWAEMITIDASTLTSSSTWVLVGLLPIAVRNLLTDNFSDQNVQFSIDNSDSSYRGNYNVQANTQATYDLSSNQVQDKGLWQPKYTAIYARNLGTIPAGNIYIGGFAGKGD